MSVGIINCAGSKPLNYHRLADVVLRNIQHRLMVYQITHYNQNPECIFLSKSLVQLLREYCLELDYSLADTKDNRTLFGVHVETYVPQAREDALEFYFSDDCYKFTDI